MRLVLESPSRGKIRRRPGAFPAGIPTTATPNHRLRPSFPRNPLSPPFAPVQRRLQSPPAKSKFLAVCVLYKVGYISNHKIYYGIRSEVPMCYRVDRTRLGVRYVDKFIKGDSGGPQFVFVRGEPILLGILWGQLSPGYGPFFSDPDNFPNINQAMKDLGGDYSLRTINLF